MLTRTVNPLIAGRVDNPSPLWAGIWLAEDIELINEGIRNRSWVDVTLGGVSAGLDGFMLYIDPASSLMQYGFSALIEHFDPLTEALEALSGDAALIAAHAQTWRNVAAQIRSNATDLAEHDAAAVWQGAAATAYRNWNGEQRVTIAALGNGCDTMATVTDCAAALVAGVRYGIRDQIAIALSRTVTWLGELTFTGGLALPLVLDQVAVTCAAVGARIARWIRALISSLRRLQPILRRLGDIIAELKRILGRLRGSGKLPDGLERVRGKGSGPRYRMTMDSVRSVAGKYGIDIAGLPIVIKANMRGHFGVTRADGSVVLFRDAFQSEEDLARTLVHEQFHANDLTSGKPYPQTDRDLQRWEDRAYEAERLWWDNQPIRPEG